MKPGLCGEPGFRFTGRSEDRRFRRAASVRLAAKERRDLQLVVLAGPRCGAAARPCWSSALRRLRARAGGWRLAYSCARRAEPDAALLAGRRRVCAAAERSCSAWPLLRRGACGARACSLVVAAAEADGCEALHQGHALLLAAGGAAPAAPRPRCSIMRWPGSAARRRAACAGRGPRSSARGGMKVAGGIAGSGSAARGSSIGLGVAPAWAAPGGS